MKCISILVVFFIAACAAISESGVLYNTFSAYSFEANSKNIGSISSKYFSADLLRNKNIQNSEISSQLLFKNYMTVTYSHLEKISGNGGCLTVNGFDDEKMPLAFNIEYIKSSERWLIKSIDILFLEDKSEFSSKPKCPYEYIN